MDLVELRAGAVPTRHPWEEARARAFLRVLARAGVADRPLDVLDVGAGDGWMARRVSERFPELARVVCWDTGYEEQALGSGAFAPAPRLEFSRARPAGRFGLLLLLDVLEHVPDDAAFLSSLVDETLAPGGHALVSVPAWPSLFGSHDRRLRHHRRYAPAAARSLVRGAGLDVLSSGGLFGAPLVVRGAATLLERITGRDRPPTDAGAWSAPPALTALVRAALSWDASVCLAASGIGLELPGLSWWALCRRPSR